MISENEKSAERDLTAPTAGDARGSTAVWLRALELAAAVPRNPSRTFPAVIAELAKRFGDAPALLSDGETLSFRALDARANRYARWARAEGISRGDTVCLFMRNRPEYMAIWIGIARAGAATALVNTNLAGASLAHCINIVAPKHIIVARSLMPVLAPATAGLIHRPQIWTHGGGEGAVDITAAIAQFSGSELLNARQVTIEDRALYVYTSGTTGLPKAAIVTHHRLMVWTHWFAGMMNTGPADRMYNCLPMYHSVGGAVATGAVLVNGGAVVISEKFSARLFWDDVTRFECTLFQYIGELCRYLVQAPPHPRENAHRLRMACGNGLRADIWDEFKCRFRIPQILEFYASTEGNVSLFNVEGQPGAIGRVPSFLAHRSPIMLVRFDGERGAPMRNEQGFCLRCATNETGEALGRISDDTGSRDISFDGYTSAMATSEKILRDVFKRGDAWYRTGDLMRCDNNGFYYFVDRIGDTFRWKGENVATLEVEAALTAYAGIVDANVYGVAVAGTDGRAGLAELVCSEDFDIAGLPDHLKCRLAKYAHPVFLRLRHTIEVTSTFKQVKRPELVDACDPDQGPLYVLDPKRRGYIPLDKALYARIADGSLRL